MGKKRMVTGMPCVSHLKQLCSGCVVAKQMRQSFPNEAQWRVSKPLELLHVDLCGPITPQSIGGNRYFLLIVGDWCRYMWVYLLKSKDDALAKFKIFKSQVEMETQHKVKALRTDRGGEVNSHAFVKFCQEEGIQRQTTTPYTPQQNKVMERRNRTVVEMTRSSLKGMNIPDSLWAKAARHAVYLLNRLPTKAVKDITPYEGWKKRKPNMEYLKIFGCLAFVKKVGGHLTKLEDRSIPMVHLVIDYGNYTRKKCQEAWLPTIWKALGSCKSKPHSLTVDASGTVTKHKARLVAKGYVQQQGVDFEDAFAPVAQMESIRLLLALAAKENWIVHHLDVKSAFLNGELKEEVYVTQPTGFKVKGKKEMVYKLHKALYGLRQAPRSWNAKLDKVLKELGFRTCAQEQAVYKLQSKNTTLIIGVYVDDIIVTGSKVKQEENSIIIKQENYARNILEEAGMSNCNPAKWPMDPKLQLTKDESGKEVDPTKYKRIIGTLRYLINTRPDLSYSVGVGTTGYGLKYRKGGNGKIYGYSDSSHASDIEDRRGTTGMMFYYSQNPVTWASQKQQTVALSSCEAEFMVATVTTCQALWLRNMCVERDQVYVEHVSGDLQKADILTKALPRVKFTEMRRLIRAEDVNIKGENVD
ncbi:zinc finger, CCHC-type containing protein [Tanacetum coccineum]|uniref:Zinc finger, CCHC-type containing protein n=1 Tax=Tanacetum coccineum TaxID=301880 RepID=A0ABQ5H710_9ASTR